MAVILLSDSYGEYGAFWKAGEYGEACETCETRQTCVRPHRMARHFLI